MDNIQHRPQTPHIPDNPLARRSRKTLVKVLNTEIPALPDNISAVQASCADPAADLIELSQLLLNDYAVTVHLYRKINSAFFSTGTRQILSMRSVVVMLGLDNVARIASEIPVLLVRGPGREKNQKALSTFLMGQAVLAANIAFSLAGFINTDPLELAACSVFCSFGDVLLSLACPGAYEMVWKIRRFPADAAKTARRLTGLTPDELGVAAARNWNMPRALICCTDSPSAPQDNLTREERFIVQVSRGINRQIFTASLPAYSKRKKLKRMQDLMDVLDIKEKHLISSIRKGVSVFEKNNSFLYDVLWKRGLLARLADI